MVVNTPIDTTQNLAEMGETLSDLQVRSERRWLTSLKGNKYALTAGIVVVLLVLMALLAPWIVPEDPKFIDPC
jgi:ABC-type dipeptide/oligopeptide/nickel transport system permease subunit